MMRTRIGAWSFLAPHTMQTGGEDMSVEWRKTRHHLASSETGLSKGPASHVEGDRRGKLREVRNTKESSAL
jgi:hypothetical protein